MVKKRAAPKTLILSRLSVKYINYHSLIGDSRELAAWAGASSDGRSDLSVRSVKERRTSDPSV